MPRKTLEEANHGANRPPRKTGGGIADWAALDWARAGKAIAQLATWGGALRFGYTRDGGAYALGVYGVDKEPYTEFIPPSEDPLEYIESLVAWMENEPVYTARR